MEPEDKGQLGNGAPQAPAKQDNPDKNGQPDAKEVRQQQQQAGSKAEVDRVTAIAVDAAVEAAKSNAQSLLDLHKKDPSIAEAAAKKLGFGNFSEAKAFVDDLLKDKDDTDKGSDFKTLYEKERGQERHEEAISTAKSQIREKIKDEELQAKALARFDEIVEGKHFSEKGSLSKATGFAETAVFDVQKESLKADASNRALEQLGSAGISQKKAPERDDEPKYVVRGGKLVLLDPKDK